jgi:hypothetical protein
LRLREAAVLIAASFSFTSGSFAQPSPSMAGIRQVHVTTDSAPGWSPSEDLESRAVSALAAFNGLLIKGSFPAAYAMLTPGNQRATSAAQWSGEMAKFRETAGKPLSWRSLKLTWTKDPADAPAPGIYAAFDFTGTYEKISRYCGYTVLYAANEQAPFKVMRIQQVFIDDASAQTIAKQQGPAALASQWETVAAACPGFDASQAH